jgi:hypothetical protein
MEAFSNRGKKTCVTARTLPLGAFCHNSSVRHVEIVGSVARFLRKTVSIFALPHAAEHALTGIDQLMKRAIPHARRNACDEKHRRGIFYGDPPLVDNHFHQKLQFEMPEPRDLNQVHDTQSPAHRQSK